MVSFLIKGLIPDIAEATSVYSAVNLFVIIRDSGRWRRFLEAVVLLVYRPFILEFILASSVPCLPLSLNSSFTELSVVVDSLVIKLNSRLALFAALEKPRAYIYYLSVLKCSTVNVFKFWLIYFSSLSIILSSPATNAHSDVYYS